MYIAVTRTLPMEIGGNQLLDALPKSVIEALVAKFELMAMPLQTVICTPGMQTLYTYFPTSAVISLQYATKRGNTYQVALIGHEGMVGASTFMGGNSRVSGLVIYPGTCYRIERCTLLQAFNQNVQVQNVLLSYIQSLMAQMSQNAVCNRHHQVDQQLCSLLLLCRDRFMSDNFILTHGQLAGMLGVRREAVTVVASRLQEEGVICYTRGHITILDHQSLESRACECYSVVKAESARLFPFQG